MKKRARNLAMLAGLAGIASALRGRGTDLDLTEEQKEDVEFMRRMGPEYSTRVTRGDERRTALPSELRAGRRRVFETEPGMRSVLRTSDDMPVMTGEGSFVRTGEYKKGGKTKAYAKGGVTRADGCAQRGHTKGRMV